MNGGDVGNNDDADWNWRIAKIGSDSLMKPEAMAANSELVERLE